MTQLFLDRIDAHTKDIEPLSERIDGLMKPFLPARELLESIPGFSQIVAEVFIAETGGDMTQFPTPGHLASWAGVSPGSNESAGRVKSTKTRPGNRYLKGALGVAALTVARSKKTYFSAKYRRLAATRGPDEGARRGGTRHAHRRLDTCSPTASSTATRAPTTSPATTPRRPEPAPSNNSKPSATRSSSSHNNEQADPHVTHQQGHQLVVTSIFVSGV